MRDRRNLIRKYKTFHNDNDSISLHDIIKNTIDTHALYLHTINVSITVTRTRTNFASFTQITKTLTHTHTSNNHSTNTKPSFDDYKPQNRKRMTPLKR